MIRSAASKVMWVGRATVFMVGLAVILALLFGVASMAFAANGDAWLLGRSNVATAMTSLGGQLGVNGPMVRIANNNAGANDTALDLRVQAGEAPMTVNRSTKVTNLNADLLDGKDISAWDAQHVLNQRSQTGGLPIDDTFTSNGGTLIIFASGSAFRNTNTVGEIAMRIVVDGTQRGVASKFTNEKLSHKTLVTNALVVEGVPAGSHTIRLEAVVEGACGTASETANVHCTLTNSDDYFDVTVMEIPA